uniref:Uncharacterized protein n=1 Tax=Arundo donax TaxID=35708 RepID=A0A0A9ETM3_ARUDO
MARSWLEPSCLWVSPCCW